MHIPFASPFGSDGAGAGTFQKLSVHCARIQMRRVRVRYAGAGPHSSRTFPACPWKFCVAASRLPCLWRLGSRGAEAGGGFAFHSYRLFFRVRALHVPCAVRFAHWGAGPHLSQYLLCQCLGFFLFFCVRKFFSSGGMRHPACPASRPRFSPPLHGFRFLALRLPARRILFSFRSFPPQSFV